MPDPLSRNKTSAGWAAHAQWLEQRADYYEAADQAFADKLRNAALSARRISQLVARREPARLPVSSSPDLRDAA